MSETPGNNPFIYDRPVADPAHFLGREVEVRRVFSRLGNMESSAIVGEKCIGKSSFLRLIAYPGMPKKFGISEKYMFIYIDLEQCSKQISPLYFQWMVLAKINEFIDSENDSRRFNLGEWSENNLLEMLPKKKPLLDRFYTEQFGSFLDTIGEAGWRIVLLLDGFETVTNNRKFDVYFFGYLRSLAINHNLALITSSNRELVELCYSKEVAGSPFFNIFSNIDLGLFTREEAGQLIEKRLAAGEQVDFNPAERDLLIHLSGGHPFFLQLSCHHLYNAYLEGLSESERRSYVFQRMRRESEPIFLDCWEHLSCDQDITLIALMLLSVLYQKTGFNIQEINPLASRSERFLHGLVRRGLLVKREERYEFFSPVFCEWIQTHMIHSTGNLDPSWEAELRNQPSVAKKLDLVGPAERQVLSRISWEFTCIIQHWFREEPPENIHRILSSFEEAVHAVDR